MPPPTKLIAETPCLIATPNMAERYATSSTSMDMSNVTMPDISEEEVLQMDTPGYYIGNG